MLSLDRVTTLMHALATNPPSRPDLGTRAAVALVLRFDEEEPQVLLMQRAERDGDRWSGQVSMPGGREEKVDDNLLATAIRETEEEVGCDLADCAELLGRLPTTQARARGELLPLTIDPFVFHCPRAPELVLGPEAVAAFWFPLAQARAGAYDSTVEIQANGTTHTLPCWRYEDRVIWGLTFEMLRGFLRRVERTASAG